jgi:hypothetical protein
VIGGDWPASRPGRLSPWKRSPVNQWRGGWVGPRAGLDDIEKLKFLSLPGEPVASSYTDYAIPVLCNRRVSVLFGENACTLIHTFFLHSTTGISCSRTPVFGVFVHRVLEIWRIDQTQSLYPQTVTTNTERIRTHNPSYQGQDSTLHRLSSKNDRLLHIIT